jgi:hypothetical protein
LKGRLPLSENIDFVPSLGITRFNEGKYDIDIPIANNQIAHAEVQSATYVVSIGGGFSGYLLKKFIAPYITAELSYDYIHYTVDYVWRRNATIPL